MTSAPTAPDPSQGHRLDALRRGDLHGARELRLRGGLTEFPRDIFGLAETLEILDLGAGALDALPDDMGRLRKLRVLFCSGNRFERLPPCLGDCAALSQIGFRGTGMREVPGEALPPGLRWLTLTDNRIETLPSALSQRPHLQKLMLAGNRLRHLPPGLAHAPKLELIRLASNAFDDLPAWLADLPALAWLSWAGNPCEPETNDPIQAAVPWADLDVGTLLGEGASGRVYRARRRGPGIAAEQAVALKLFKGAMTSDGLPEREIAACLAAGDHPNLTGAFGRLDGHPDGTQGLVMPLLPDHWRGLAGPPSLESCSRDVYAADLRLNPVHAVTIVRSVAAGAGHLHARGLLHGDLYAHNIVWDAATGDAVLSDFGAASVLPSGALGDALRHVEVRALGILIEELSSRSMPEDVPALSDLAGACTQPDRRARPSMAEVLAFLPSSLPQYGRYEAER